MIKSPAIKCDNEKVIKLINANMSKEVLYGLPTLLTR